MQNLTLDLQYYRLLLLATAMTVFFPMPPLVQSSIDRSKLEYIDCLLIALLLLDDIYIMGQNGKIQKYRAPSLSSKYLAMLIQL
jgi:hypothetical protein